MNRFRILQVVTNLGCGGAERMVVNLMTHLDPRRFEVAAISLAEPGGWALEQVLAKANIRVWHLGKKAGFAPEVFSGIRNLVRQFRPHVVHSHMCLHYVFPALMCQRSLSFVDTVHLPGENQYRRSIRWINQSAFRLGVLPIAVSSRTADWVKDVYGVQECAVIRNGIPIKDYALPGTPRQAWRKEHGFKEDDVLFVCAARFDKQKNHQMLLEAFARGPGRESFAYLLLAGEGELKHDLEAQVQRLGLQEKVRFLGRLPSVSDALGAADIFVLASENEGNPLALMEAMAAGLPVVATAVGGVPELVENQNNGLLVKLGDREGMSAAMLELLTNAAMRKAMAGRAAENAARHFTASRMGHEYMELYGRILARQTPHTVGLRTRKPVVWKRSGVRVAEQFFDGASTVPVGADIIRYHQQSGPLAGFACTPFHTRVIDLQQSPEEILAAMEPDNRKSIRRSEKKDPLVYCCSDDGNSALLREVCDLHDNFAVLKAQPRINRARLSALSQAGLLDISLMRDTAGNPLVWRIYYRDNHRARNLHNGSLHRAVSDSAQRNLIGRAHRYAVWKDILRFKEAGLQSYDFGGWYIGTDDSEKLKINLFKKEFGGSIETGMNCVRGATLRARLILAFLDLRERMLLRRRSNSLISKPENAVKPAILS